MNTCREIRIAYVDTGYRPNMYSQFYHMIIRTTEPLSRIIPADLKKRVVEEQAREGFKLKGTQEEPENLARKYIFENF